MPKKDVWFSVGAGLLIGPLFLIILQTAKPDLYESLRLIIPLFFLVATPLGALIAYKIGLRFALAWQLAKFVVIGGMNTLVDIGFLALITSTFKNFGIQSGDLIFAGLGILTFYSLFKATSFIIANVNSYYWNKFWTFSGSGSAQKTSAQFLQFFLVSLVGFFLNVLVASLVFRLFSPLSVLNSDQWGLLGAMAGSLSGLVWNFLGYKFIVFKKKV